MKKHIRCLCNGKCIGGIKKGCLCPLHYIRLKTKTAPPEAQSGNNTMEKNKAKKKIIAYIEKQYKNTDSLADFLFKCNEIVGEINEIAISYYNKPNIK